eukprot:15248015-Alexandrium_andersonii.AAC.1
MEEAAAPDRPAGPNVLVPPSESAEVARRPRHPELQLKGSPTSADPQHGTRTFRPAGLLRAAASSIWDFGPWSSFANELF